MAPEPPWVRELPGHLTLGPLRGRGSYGEVYQATDRRRGQPVAIKALTVQMDAPTRRRFAREAEVLAGLEHPHILRILDRGEAAGVPFLVLEYLEGRSLEEAIPRVDPLAILLPIADALLYAHSRGVLHRDVKAGNVLWTTEARPVLVDFGLVTRPGATQLTATGAVVGSLGYLSPELLRGEDHTPASDLWAWAVTLYEVCEHRLPFPAERLQDAMAGAPLGMPPFQRLGPADPERRVLEAFFDREAPARPASLEELESLAAASGPQATGGWSAAAPAAASVASTGVHAGAGPSGASSGSRGSSGLHGRAPVAAAALVAMVVAFLLSGRQGGGTPTPPPTDPASRFGPAFAARVRDELAALPACPDPPREPWSPCRDRDPLRWSAVLDALPSAREFEAWVLGGGRPEELPASVRGELREVGETFRERGLPSPFHPWTLDAPRDMTLEEFANTRVRLENAMRLKHFPVPPGPWLSRALRALVRVAAAEEELPEDTFFQGLGNRTGKPSDLLGEELLSLRKRLKLRYHDRIFRIRAARVMEAAQRDLQTMAYALGRACDADAPDLPRRVILGLRILRRGDELWFGPAAFTHPYRVLGRRPRVPAQHALLLRLAEAFEGVRDAAEAEESAQEMRALEQASAEAAAAIDPGAGTFAERVHRRAQNRLRRLAEDDD